MWLLCAYHDFPKHIIQSTLLKIHSKHNTCTIIAWISSSVLYIIPGDELGNLATVFSTKKTEIWTNQMKVILFNECPRTIAKLC